MADNISKVFLEMIHKNFCRGHMSRSNYSQVVLDGLVDRHRGIKSSPVAGRQECCL